MSNVSTRSLLRNFTGLDLGETNCSCESDETIIGLGPKIFVLLHNKTVLANNKIKNSNI